MQMTGKLFFLKNSRKNGQAYRNEFGSIEDVAGVSPCLSTTLFLLVAWCQIPIITKEYLVNQLLKQIGLFDYQFYGQRFQLNIPWPHRQGGEIIHYNRGCTLSVLPEGLGKQRGRKRVGSPRIPYIPFKSCLKGT